MSSRIRRPRCAFWRPPWWRQGGVARPFRGPGGQGVGGPFAGGTQNFGVDDLMLRRGPALCLANRLPIEGQDLLIIACLGLADGPELPAASFGHPPSRG